jgi:hypothetical protein
MRYREFKEQQDTGSIAVANTSTVANQQPNSTIQPDVELKSSYADSTQINDVIKSLKQNFPKGKFDNKPARGPKKVRHIRAYGVNFNQLSAFFQQLGATTVPTDHLQQTASGSYPAYSFQQNNVLYTVVIGMKGQSQDANNVGISRKELTPAGLNIAGKTLGIDELISAVKKEIADKFKDRDPMLEQALISLIDSASNGGNIPLPEDQLNHIQPFLGTLSQDFGEILAPILIMQPNDKVEFPSGNNPIVDVKLPGVNLSVKSLSGSGTSFRTISQLMDKFEKELDVNDTEKKEQFQILKQFHPDTGGSNTDKIIRAVSKAKTAEYDELLKILGSKEISSWNELSKEIDKKISGANYSTFLKTFYPMMVAGNWGKPVGLPADGNYYMGLSDKAKKEKAAGKPSYDADPIRGATDIITYALGVGLLNYIRRGKNAGSYKEMMTSIVSKADAVIGHITINPNGTLKLITRPFSDLKFEFQYHAPSHIPGNNLPGFIAVLD